MLYKERPISSLTNIITTVSIKLGRVLLYGFVLVMLGSGCKSPASELQELDLMSEGIPIKIKAPVGAKVKKKDMGLFQDITIKDGEDFYIQITAGQLYNSNAKVRKTEELEAIKQLISFSRIIKEDEQGFIFERKKGDELTYDFRRIKIQGETEYLFQTGLVGNFDLESVELMYDAVK